MTKPKKITGLLFQDRNLYFYENGKKSILAVFVSKAASNLVESKLSELINPIQIEVKRMRIVCCLICEAAYDEGDQCAIEGKHSGALYGVCPTCRKHAEIGKRVETEDPSLIERLACYAHSAWARWMKYQWLNESAEAPIGGEPYRKRWERQANAKYSELSDAEKKSDRAEARAILDCLREAKGEK